MRVGISIAVAVSLFIGIIYLAYSGTIVFPDYWTALAVALTVTALGTSYWDSNQEITDFFRKRRKLKRLKLILSHCMS